jgi:hypothetical protein
MFHVFQKNKTVTNHYILLCKFLNEQFQFEINEN